MKKKINCSREVTQQKRMYTHVIERGSDKTVIKKKIQPDCWIRVLFDSVWQTFLAYFHKQYTQYQNCGYWYSVHWWPTKWNVNEYTKQSTRLESNGSAHLNQKTRDMCMRSDVATTLCIHTFIHPTYVRTHSTFDCRVCYLSCYSCVSIAYVLLAQLHRMC